MKFYSVVNNNTKKWMKSYIENVDAENPTSELTFEQQTQLFPILGVCKMIWLSKPRLCNDINI